MDSWIVYLVFANSFFRVSFLISLWDANLKKKINSKLSKKSRPTGYVPLKNLSSLIARFATYLGVRWDSVPFNFWRKLVTAPNLWKRCFYFFGLSQKMDGFLSRGFKGFAFSGLPREMIQFDWNSFFCPKVKRHGHFEHLFCWIASKDVQRIFWCACGFIMDRKNPCQSNLETLNHEKWNGHLSQEGKNGRLICLSLRDTLPETNIARENRPPQ